MSLMSCWIWSSSLATGSGVGGPAGVAEGLGVAAAPEAELDAVVTLDPADEVVAAWIDALAVSPAPDGDAGFEPPLQPAIATITRVTEASEVASLAAPLLFRSAPPHWISPPARDEE
jgi:hypothetical protein